MKPTLRRTAVLVGALLLLGAGAAVLMVQARTRREQSAEAIALLREWGLPGVHQGLTGKVNHSAIMGGTCHEIVLTAPRSQGGLQTILGSLERLEFDDPVADAASIHELISLSVDLPRLEEAKGAGNAKFPGIDQIYFIRFKNEDVVLVRRIKL